MLIKATNLDLHCIEPLIYHSPQLVRSSDQSGSECSLACIYRFWFKFKLPKIHYRFNESNDFLITSKFDSLRTHTFDYRNLLLFFKSCWCYREVVEKYFVCDWLIDLTNFHPQVVWHKISDEVSNKKYLKPILCLELVVMFGNQSDQAKYGKNCTVLLLLVILTDL